MKGRLLLLCVTTGLILLALTPFIVYTGEREAPPQPAEISGGAVICMPPSQTQAEQPVQSRQEQSMRDAPNAALLMRAQTCGAPECDANGVPLARVSHMLSFYQAYHFEDSAG